jgi:hypothetical protein
MHGFHRSFYGPLPVGEGEDEKKDQRGIKFALKKLAIIIETPDRIIDQVSLFSAKNPFYGITWVGVNYLKNVLL